MTRLVTAGAVLVLAIVFGFIFWNQFSSNQHQLAGGKANPVATNSSNSAIPKNDNLDMIDASLSGSSIDSIDSDSSQLDARVRSY